MEASCLQHWTIILDPDSKDESADTSNVRFQEADIDRNVLNYSTLWEKLEGPPTGNLHSHRRALRM